MNQIRCKPLLFGLLAGYALYCLAVPALLSIRHLLPEFLDWIFWLYILWPYPLVLALQTWATPQSIASNLLVYTCGLLIVFAWGRWLQQRFGASRPNGWALAALAFWLWAVPLLLFEWALSWGLSALGYPVGE
jgi:hypothetical protein